MDKHLLSRVARWLGALALVPLAQATEPIVLNSVVRQGDRLLVAATLSPGFRSVVLEGSDSLPAVGRRALAATTLNGGDALVTFRIPPDQAARFLTLRAGPEADLPATEYTGPGLVAVTYLSDVPLSAAERVDHVLNRVAYGPSRGDLDWVQSVGVGPHLELQLDPDRIDESSNQRLREAEAALVRVEQPREDTLLVRPGEVWRYFKGTQAPPAGWNQPGFDDAAWLAGATGVGYGDNDDATVLEDMRQTATQPGYLSVFLRRGFRVQDPTALGQLILRVDFDDGFVAYLNGVEVARANVTGNPPAYNRPASDNHEAGQPVEYDLSSRKDLLRAGANVLAIQVHNYDLASSDLSLIPALLSRKSLPGDPVVRIRGIEELQQLIHVRGAYARRQLQAVLAEFWVNHFTTDADKVAQYFDDLQNSDGTDAMSSAEASVEAAQASYEEYQFFHDHALGQFGDLLLYSATSPAMLIYLDSVLNLKDAPNENYAREVLELFGFGVDNRYTQQDIEELARCFTGWSLRKVQPPLRPAFPASAREPLTSESVTFAEDALVEVGGGWTYFKGQREPSPGPAGAATTAWTTPDFDDSAWLTGATSIGYGDNDDATVLGDMRNGYASVYLRRPFTVAAGQDLSGLLFSVRYDDGFVAYLNGIEIARSATMDGTGTPPAYHRLANGGHEVSRPTEVFNLEPFLSLIRPAPAVNVLAVQVHNVELDSSDLSIHPRLLWRRPLPGSIENGDPNGVWVFRFNPAEHDTGAKRLFAGTPYEIRIPAGRAGREGVRDALDVLDAMVSHPSTREFICLKLVNKFVSDDINLVSYHNGTAPEPLRRLLDDALAAWMSTTPPGHIQTVLRAILRPQTLDGYFWSHSAYRVKVKTPVEFINSSLRALDATAGSALLPAANDTLGMHLFTRDDPDGWSELGLDWMDTSGLLERVKFLQGLAGNLDASLSWNVKAFLSGVADQSAGGIVDYVNGFLFGGRITDAQRALLVRFATTDDQGAPLPWDPARTDYQRRLQDLVALLLALPQWHNQ